VFDGIDPGSDRGERAEQPFSVRRYFSPQRMSFRDGGLNFFTAEMLVLKAVAFRHRASGRPDFDNVSAIPDRLPNRFAHRIHAVHHHRHRRAAAQPLGRNVVHIAVATCHAQAQMRRYRAGSKNRPLIDGPLYRNTIARAISRTVVNP